MASRGKKTTMAKLARESRLRERRIDKQARKDARKRAAEMDPDLAMGFDAQYAAEMNPGRAPGMDPEHAPAMNPERTADTQGHDEQPSPEPESSDH
jgi:hypothetical protein